MDPQEAVDRHAAQAAQNVHAALERFAAQTAPAIKAALEQATQPAQAALDRAMQVPRDQSAAVPPASIHQQIAQQNPAYAFYRNLKEQIEEVKASLADDEDVLLCTSWNGGMVRLESCGCHGPHTFIMNGVDHQGNKVQLVAHVATVSVAIVCVSRMPDTPRRSIGFLTPAPQSPVHELQP
jgi:hypothetical protein